MWYSPIHGKVLKKQAEGRGRGPVRARCTVVEDLATEGTVKVFLLVLSICSSSIY